MGKTSSKKWLALLMTLVVVLSCTFGVSAAPAAKTFKVRLSDGYGYAGADITMTPSNSKGTEGTIKFKADVTWTLPEGWSITLSKGTTYDYKISNLKEGGKITLVINSKKTDLESYIDACAGGVARLTGVIHISGSAKFANIWKIDTFTRHITNNGISPKDWSYGVAYPSNKRPGIYFRDT